MFKAVIAISLGASLGAVLRWLLSDKFNVGALIPLGTLYANLIAGYVIGLAIALFSHHLTLSTEMRLFVITGFCGGLSTFSTFSSEVVRFIEQAHFGTAAAIVLLHVVGSISMTFLGLWSYHLLFKH